MKKPAIWCALTAAGVFLVFLAAFSWHQAHSRAPILISEVSGVQADEVPEGLRVNINTASMQQLQTLPGIGPALAQRIVQYRQENGPFSSVSQITLVKGIGLSVLDRILDYITVGD